MDLPHDLNFNLPQVFALNEVAQAYRVSPHTIRAWVQQGRLHPLRICRRLLFTKEELNRFLATPKQ